MAAESSAVTHQKESSGRQRPESNGPGRIVAPGDLVGMLPQAGAFRFIDEVLEIDRMRVVARFRFRGDEFFYPGHFPEQPITPGVILLEAMAQCGLTIYGLYLLSLELGPEKAQQYRMLFTAAQAEWHSLVRPGTTIVLRGELLLWRLRQLRCRVRILDESDSLLAESVVSGRAVQWNSDGTPMQTRTPTGLSHNTEMELQPKDAPDESK